MKNESEKHFTDDEIKTIIGTLDYLELDRTEVDKIKKQFESSAKSGEIISSVNNLLSQKEISLEAEEQREEVEYKKEIETIDTEEHDLEKDFDEYYDESIGTEEEFAEFDNLDDDEVSKKIDQVYSETMSAIKKYESSKKQEDIDNVRHKIDTL